MKVYKSSLRFLFVLATIFTILILGNYESAISAQVNPVVIFAQIDSPVMVKVQKDGRNTLLVPVGLLESIKSNFAGYRVPTQTDFSDAWIEYPGGPFSFITWGDYNGDGRVDIAVILLNDKKWKFIIFHHLKDGYKPAYIAGDEFDIERFTIQFPQQIVLLTIKKEEGWSTERGDVPIEYPHKYDAVAFSAYEKGRVYLYLIYWKDGKYFRYK